MLDWSNDARYLIEKIVIHYKGHQYEGNGVMNWNPDKGFHIDGQLKRLGPPLPKKRSYGGYITTPEDTRVIRMYLHGSRRAIIAGFRMVQNFAIAELGNLDLDSDHVIFIDKEPKENRFIGFGGNLLLAHKNLIGLPNPVKRETYIANKKINESQSFSGLIFEDEQLKIRIWDKKDDILECQYSFDERFWSRAEAWRFGIAVESALSLLGGQSVRLLERSVSRGKCIFTERRKRWPVVQLSYCSPFSMSDRFTSSEIVNLISFLVGKSKESRVCRNILSQLCVAKNQETVQGVELLSSSILEALLRILDNHPFKSGDYSWKIKSSFKKFKRKYFGEKWDSYCDKVFQAFESLRHRNAHPDWLISQDGQGAREVAYESLNQLILLNRFYGYVIIALSGIREVSPEMPDNVEIPED